MRRNQWRALGGRVLIALVACVLVTGVGLATSKRITDTKFGDIRREAFGEGVLTPDELDDDPGEPTNFLIVGSDSREFVDDEEGEAAFGDVGGQRSDTIMVAHVDPGTNQAVLVSFPRDLVVDIPGRGTSKVNSAFNSDRGGSPELLVLTLKQNFGIDISHYVAVDFAGFARIVDAIGRVKIYFPAPARDEYTGLSVKYYGCGELNGEEALSYVRSRHYEYFDFEEGDWNEDPSQDFGRIRRQQYFIRSLMQQTLDRTSRLLYKAFDLIDRTQEMVTVDEGLTVDDFKKLAQAFIDTDSAAVEMYTVPVRSDGDALVLRDDEAAPILARLELLPVVTPDIDLSQFTIDVLNGNGSLGVAQAAIGELRAIGFTGGRVGDAETDSLAQTELRYSTEQGLATAELVKAYLDGAGVAVEVADTGSTADLVIVLGEDFTAVRDPGVTTTTSAQVIDEPASTTATTVQPNPGDEPTDDPNVDAGSQYVGCD